jgi:hypothetical protein
MIAQSDGYVYYGIGDLESHSRKLKVNREMESMKNSINPAPKYQASIPIGWISIGADDEKQLYILGHQTLPGMIFLLPSASNNAKEIIQVQILKIILLLFLPIRDVQLFHWSCHILICLQRNIRRVQISLRIQ